PLELRGVAEVTLDGRGDVVHELVREQGLVEPPLRPLLGNDLGAQVGVAQGPVRRSGHHPEQDEVEQDDQDDRDDRLAELAEDIASAHRGSVDGIRVGGCWLGVALRGGAITAPESMAAAGRPPDDHSSSSSAAPRRRKTSNPPTTTTTSAAIPTS